MGVQVTKDVMIHGDQYADDTHALLKSMSAEHVANFLLFMDIFSRASGQHLNRQKTVILPVGATHADAVPTQVQGLSVVSEAASLGVIFSNDSTDPQPAGGWPQRRISVLKSLRKIAKLRLTCFGRSSAAFSYGISSILSAAEHCGLPPPLAMELDRSAYALIDRGQPPTLPDPEDEFASSDDEDPRPTSHDSNLPRCCLVAHPRSGGFGQIPVAAHLHARAAASAHRLIMWMAGDPSTLISRQRRSLLRLLRKTGGPSPDQLPPEDQLLLELQPVKPTWVSLAAAILYHAAPSSHPAFTLQEAHRLQPALPSPLRRMGAGLAALGALCQVRELDTTPGPWCSAMPLWHNPLLPQLLHGPPSGQGDSRVGVSRAAAGASGGDGDRGGGGRGDAAATAAAAASGGSAADGAAAGGASAGRSTSGVADSAVGSNNGFLRQARGLPATYPLLRPPPLTPAALATLRALPTLQSVGDAWRFWLLQLGQLCLVQAAVRIAPTSPLLAALLHLRQATLLLATSLLSALPEAWGAACASTPQAAAAAAGDTINHLISSILGWRSAASPLPLALSDSHFSVRLATQFQLHGEVEKQCLRRLTCVAWALASGARGAGSGQQLAVVPTYALQPAVQVEGAALSAHINDLWSLHWANEYKEPLWRLLTNGFRGRHCRGPCPCGWAPQGTSLGPLLPLHSRMHAFWDCPVAAAVVSELQRGLGVAAPPLTCADVWLLRRPSALRSSVIPGAWALICMVAVFAMERGRRAIWRGHLGGMPDASTVASACRGAVAWFWLALQDFVDAEATPLKWGAIPSSHPFFGGIPVVLHVPLEFILPADEPLS